MLVGRSRSLFGRRGVMGCGASVASVESPGQHVQPHDEEMRKVAENDGVDQQSPTGETVVIEHTLFGRCGCGRVHKRDYLASKFGNPYLASSNPSSEGFSFSYCPLPRLSQPAAHLAQLTTKPTLADGEISPPPNRSIAGSASANWLDLPPRWQQQQQQQLLALTHGAKKTADELRADAVNTWINKR